ncbi:protein slowmo-like isoform X1 [Portunus trituberculatus]|uniref:Protein slowmo n=2 Tax=Portunus trituberculatus TaxID=210409 RepID=A0A5B7EJS6_PORTR|nr:protein slowmo-like isoform X1 [Portunus trituberculatus]MPC32774.1 Protein slowmo [Portunus trituberculatus]
MKIWTSEHIFSHPWETVTQAVWRKYPNPHNPAVVGTDVIERHVMNGVLHTHRLISSRWGLPNWAQTILGADRVCYGYEHSEVNPEERTMTMRTRNLTFASTVSMDERLVYSPDPNNSENTVLRQETIITVKGVPLTSYMENYLLNSISNNSFKGRDAMEFVISKINREVEDLVSTYKRSTSEILDHTKRSLGEITESALRSVDDISLAAKKSVDGLSDAAKKSIDDISCVAKKGIDTFTQPAPAGSMPRI